MAYVFKNQPTATATIKVSGANNTFKLAGINGEQSDAGNFRTAITDFVGIAGINVAQESDGMQRNINQAVTTDESGTDPEFTLSSTVFDVSNLGEMGFTSSISVANYELDLSLITWSGKKPIGASYQIDTDENMFKIIGRAQGYTEGTNSAIATVTLPAQTVGTTHYRSASVDITFMNGTTAEFEDIT